MEGCSKSEADGGKKKKRKKNQISQHQRRCNPSSVSDGYLDSNVLKNNTEEQRGLFPQVHADPRLQGGGQSKDIGTYRQVCVYVRARLSEILLNWSRLQPHNGFNI